MLAGHRHFRLVAVVALALGSGLWAREATAHPHRSYHHGYGSGIAVFPSFAVAVGPGALPVSGTGVGLGLGLGVGYYPFSVGVGVALPGSPTDPRGSLRTDVPQKDTEVFIDGYYAGLVDDFDGSFQKLRLEPGPHVVTLYLDGYRLYEESVNSTFGTTVKIRHEMEPLGPGEPIPSRPFGGAPVAPSRFASGPPPPSAPTAALAAAPPPSKGASTQYGVLSIRTEPSGVGVWIDGELWEFPTGTDRLSVHLPVGAHSLKLSREGYDDFELGVELAPGETNALNVRLSPSP